MGKTFLRRARTRHSACGGYCRTIRPGEQYLEHIAFPGEDGAEEARHPIRMAECSGCAIRYGRGYLLTDPEYLLRSYL